MNGINVKGLLAQASEQAGGLADFGPGNYREALDVLSDSLAREAGLSQQGEQLLQAKLQAQLVNRLVIQDYCRRHPGILQERVEDPLVIVGLPRTGTTLLQRMLATDARFCSAAWWETRYPAPLPGEDVRDASRRIALARDEVAQMIRFIPDILAIHPLDAMAADEEFMLMEHSFLCAMDSYANVPGYTGWLACQDRTEVYDYLKTILQFLQWQKRQRGEGTAQRWVLKTPQHLHTLEVLFRVFPGAQVVLTHRDPVQTIPSMASMAHTLWKMYADAPDPVAVGRQWSEQMRRGTDHAMAVRDAMPAGRFLDVRFEDTVRDPFGVAQAVYRFAGMPLTEAARAGMWAWMESNPRNRRAAHAYTPEQFGLSQAQLARDFAGYRARHVLSRD
ncbi:sulfotransferase family protein [Cupriavidus oxalaticus]|uniref:Hydrolase n=1 Tax=Cupriavidus oxalaticus TaxID=96344 RepID=A0A375GBW0_9BURK|nr:sulfotransferase [Cupriavidus oxalaticus]QRQ84096.1 sulfotransferase [Cupriavidus oxalaticus]QRQ91815.1 sulfotransferase [Cupriavidus oxalaticus]WQD86405.1 sulfotransferase [Cupriavidus oxalaticus]SPC17729.1 putative hydrolase [Cupriavidus oxalaticus]